MAKKPVVVFILGPTAVGKSEFAIALANKIGGEIISCDSMQVYKGMAVMSQQPGARLRKIVPHHLVGALSPSREWNAADFVEAAGRIAKDAVRRGHIPVIVGGTGLYARAFIKGLFPSPPKDEGLRRSLYEEAGKKGKKRLYERLKKIDPAYASKIHPNDLRRVVRALEVYELTGKPISEQHIKTRGAEDIYRILIFILNRDCRELYKRIDRRVDEMFAAGIKEEVKKLRKRKIGRTAQAVLGYREISNYIAGKLTPEEAKELLKRNTRRYAKRQLTWFRKEENARWLELSTKKKNSALLKTVTKEIVNS